MRSVWISSPKTRIKSRTQKQPTLRSSFWKSRILIKTFSIFSTWNEIPSFPYSILHPIFVSSKNSILCVPQFHSTTTQKFIYFLCRNILSFPWISCVHSQLLDFQFLYSWWTRENNIAWLKAAECYVTTPTRKPRDGITGNHHAIMGNGIFQFICIKLPKLFLDPPNMDYTYPHYCNNLDNLWHKRNVLFCVYHT